jgi:hypothetical protein
MDPGLTLARVAEGATAARIDPQPRDAESTGPDRWFDRGPWLGVVAGAVLVLLLAALIGPAIARNGEFTYPIDDSYIHLAIGRNLAEHGVLGINPGEFASASSSPVWPLLIAGSALVVGPRVGIPLVLALMCALVLLVGLDRWAMNRGFSATERSLFLVAVMVVVPLPVLTLTGMEHVLQAGLSFLLLWLSVVAATNVGRTRYTLALLGLAAFLCAATRYEGLFVVAAAVVVLATARRWKEIATVVVAGVAPVFVAGLIYSGQGWPFLPASVVAKTEVTRTGLARYLPTPDLDHWIRTPRLVAVVALVVLVLAFGRRAMGAAWPRRNTLWSVGVLVLCGLHLLYASTGFFYRYEGYLIVLCLGAAALGVHTVRAAGRLPSVSLVLRLAAAFLLLVAGVDGLRIYGKAEAGMDEIHQQQIQMARFAATACPGCRVAVNDIGAVATYGDGTVLDVFGLANRDVLQTKLDGTYDVAALGRIARSEDTQLAMVYPAGQGMIPGVPAGWERIGSWRLEGVQVVGGPEVVFYSTNPARTDALRRAFEDFEPTGGTKGS